MPTAIRRLIAIGKTPMEASTTTKPIRVAVAGAAGRIGYSLVFRIAAGGLFGRDQPVALSLLELHEALPRLEACAMELKDCAYPLLTDLKIGTDPRELFQGADWIILLGGKPLSAETGNRIDLLRANAPTMVEQGRAINQAAPTARILVVAQPCNTNCLIAQSQATRRSRRALVRAHPAPLTASDEHDRRKDRRAR